MGRIKKRTADTVESIDSTKKQFEIENNSGNDKLNLKRNEERYIKPQKNSFKKKDFVNIINTEYQFISSLFDILDLAKLNLGRKNESDEEDNSERMQLAEIPEQKVFKNQTQKKGASQVGNKRKSFPHTIEGLEKELAELKGTTLSYQMSLRKKGLQARLTKKKKKDQRKLDKTALKKAKNNRTANGLSKPKPILSNDGTVISNKFDFADMDIKKDHKKKLTANKEISASQSVNIPNGHLNQSASSKENLKSSFKSDLIKNITAINSSVKRERNIVENTKMGTNNDIQPTTKPGPVFNKDNKMVFSKVYLPENHKKLTKKESKKRNPKKILEKLKEENKKISQLEKEDREKAVSLKEKQKWAAALKRASGEKVKDDPELLRKSISREKNQKMRSQKKWKARIERVEKERGEKQKKRKDNLQSRKNEKKKKKMKKAIKKGSFVPL